MSGLSTTDPTVDMRIGGLLDERRRRLRNSFLALVGLGALSLLAAWITDLLDLVRIWKGLFTFGDMFARSMPPDFGDWQKWVWPLIDTLGMSVAATVVCVILSLPLALLSSPNTTPHPVVYFVARNIMNFLRAVPELIMGIFYVAAWGFGALPGVLALALHSTGMVAKFYAEAIEHVDNAPIEAAQAAGATRLQVITHGVLPQVFSQLVDVTLYRWEYHFRASTVVGLVGAGGIGFHLIASIRLVQYDKAVAMLIIIFFMVLAIDGLSAYLRRCLK